MPWNLLFCTFGSEKELLAKKMQDANITKIKETHIKEEATKPEQEAKPRSKAQKDANKQRGWA